MISVMLKEIERELRTQLNLPAEQLGARFNHKPPPISGNRYVAIYGTEIAAIEEDLNTGIDIGYSIGITVTQRIEYNPYDMLDTQLFLKDSAGMEVILYKCCAYLHQNFDLLGLFNNSIRLLYASAPAYIEPLRFRYMDATPTIVTERWFEPEFSLEQSLRSPTQNYPYCGMIMEASLGGCRRTLTKDDLLLEVPIL